MFDLDGTLTDPKEGITKSVRHALNHYGIQVDDLDNLTPFIGPPLTDSYKKYYGFSDEQAWEGVLVYREYFSERGMAGYFDFIGGADMGETRVRKADVIRYVLEQYGLDASPETLARCVMVGDREHDVLGARECGMDCVGVLYGYGDRREMDGCRPAWTADTVDELKDLLLIL